MTRLAQPTLRVVKGELTRESLIYTVQRTTGLSLMVLPSMARYSKIPFDLEAKSRFVSFLAQFQCPNEGLGQGRVSNAARPQPNLGTWLGAGTHSDRECAWNVPVPVSNGPPTCQHDRHRHSQLTGRKAVPYTIQAAKERKSRNFIRIEDDVSIAYDLR